MNQMQKTAAVAVTCGLIGKGLHDWPAYPNWAIPHAVCISGVVISLAAFGISFESAFNGLMAGWASTGAHQSVNQIRTLDKE